VQHVHDVARHPFRSVEVVLADQGDFQDHSVEIGGRG
jgi:hypothetical protein